MKFVYRGVYISDQEKFSAIRPSHIEYIKKLFDEGKIILSGPAEKGGMTVFDVSSREELDKVLATDPFFQNGLVASYDVYSWEIFFVKKEML